MPYGKGTYGSKRGRPSKKAKAAGRKKMNSKGLSAKQKKLPKKLQNAIMKKKKKNAKKKSSKKKS